MAIKPLPAMPPDITKKGREEKIMASNKMRCNNKNLINRLATCEYISEHRNLFITGATGCGKTYMAFAFGMEACKQYFNTKYVRLPDLLRWHGQMAVTKKSWLSMPILLS